MPRPDEWGEHFPYRGATIIGLTLTGQVTADVLNMNEENRLRLRHMLLANGELD